MQKIQEMSYTLLVMYMLFWLYQILIFHQLKKSKMEPNIMSDQISNQRGKRQKKELPHFKLFLNCLLI